MAIDKKWCKEEITEKEIKYIKDFVKSLELNIKLKIVRDKDHSCWNAGKRSIVLNIKPYSTIQGILSSLFHELGHCYCYDLELHKRYHHNICNQDETYYRMICKCGLRAERFVDKVGKKLMKAYFPDIQYLRGYTKWGERWWKIVWMPILKEKYDYCSE